MIDVLVVDDNLATVRGLRMLLEMEPDIRVRGEAYDGVQAVELAEALRPDVVVMDLQMPGLDGISATALIKKRLPETAVVILTVYCAPVQRRAAELAGADAFWEKDGPCCRKLVDLLRLLAARNPV